MKVSQVGGHEGRINGGGVQREDATREGLSRHRYPLRGNVASSGESQSECQE